MLPFKVPTVVMCDDIRMEHNNKFILVGVYNGTLLVGGFPAQIPLCWWLQLIIQQPSKFEVELQLVKDDSSTLLRAMVGFDAVTPGWAAMPLPKVELQLQGPGKVRLQLKLKSDSEWETVHEFEVALGPVPDNSLGARNSNPLVLGPPFA